MDATFNTGMGANHTVRSLAVQSDGKVVIAGFFQTVNGALRSGIARLNADGSLDDKFDPGEGASGGGAWAMVLQPSGGIVVAGAFTGLNQVTCGRIARLCGGSK